MGKDHRGHPSGVNKNDGGTGVPEGKYVEDLKRDEELTKKYTDGEDGITNNVHRTHPNRNTDKDDPTNAGGYKH